MTAFVSGWESDGQSGKKDTEEEILNGRKRVFLGKNSNDSFFLSAGHDPPEAETERRRSVIHNTSKQRLWIARASLATLRQLVRENP